MRVIPAIDLRDGRCVRLVQGDYGREVRYDLDPVEVARGYARAGAALVHVVDLDAARAGGRKNAALIAEIVRAAHGAGMEVVLSVRTDDELEFALDTDVDVLNIDNRDEGGSVDVERTFELLADVPVGWPVISESIDAIDKVSRLHRAGVDALLLDEGHIDTGLTSALAVYATLALEPE